MSRIDEIKARLETVTAWKKHSLELFEGGYGYEILDQNGETVLDNQTYYTTPPSEPEADFIAHAPDDIAYLLAEVERLREAGLGWQSACTVADAERDRYRAALEEVAEHKPDTWAGERAREALKNE
jgi:hypothetical protein